MSLVDTFDTEGGDDSKKDKGKGKTPPATKPATPATPPDAPGDSKITVDFPGLDTLEKLEDDAVQQTILEQEKKIKVLEKQFAQAQLEKDDIEKKTLIDQLKKLKLNTKSLGKQPLAVVKAAAQVLMDSGKDIIVNTKADETISRGKTITVQRDGKKVNWRGRPDKDDKK